MKNFSIRELADLSGIKAPTIRVWEKRYTVFQPQRSKGNVRKYTVDELDKLLTLSLLSNHRFKISHIALLSNDELRIKIKQLTNETARIDRMIHSLVVNMYSMDPDAFEAVLDECFLSWPSDFVVQKILFPFLEKVNLLFEGKRRNEEHLVVTVIRQKLHWSIEQVRAPKENRKTILLFLSGERQLDLLLLYCYHELKKSGWKVIYMGVDISLKNVEEMLRLKQSGYLLTYVPKKSSLPLEALSEKVRSIDDSAVVLLVHPEENYDRTQPAYNNIRILSCKEAIDMLTNK